VKGPSVAISGNTAALHHKIEKEDPDADGNRRVGQIEDGPNPEIEEVHHGPHADPVDPISQGAPQNEAQGGLIFPGGAGKNSKEKEGGNAEGDHQEKGPVPSLKKPEGDALVFHQREVKNPGEERLTRPRHEIILGEGFGELIQKKNQTGQQEEDFPA
jgi:hypothetical protein